MRAPPALCEQVTNIFQRGNHKPDQTSKYHAGCLKSIRRKIACIARFVRSVSRLVEGIGESLCYLAALTCSLFHLKCLSKLSSHGNSSQNVLPHPSTNHFGTKPAVCRILKLHCYAELLRQPFLIQAPPEKARILQSVLSRKRHACHAKAK